MGLNDIAKSDWNKITSDAGATGAGQELIFQSKGNNIAIVNGLATTHHMSVEFDPESGREKKVSTKNAHCSVSESLLIDAGYPVRNSDNRVDMVGDTVTYTNSAGITLRYSIAACFPDETIGVIMCILQSIKQ